MMVQVPGRNLFVDKLNLQMPLLEDLKSVELIEFDYFGVSVWENILAGFRVKTEVYKGQHHIFGFEELKPAEEES